MSSSPKSVASSALLSRTVRLYRSPSVEDEAKDVVVPKPETPKDDRTVLGWKVAARCGVPKSAGRLRASPCVCCVKCAHTYFNFLGSCPRAYSSAVIGKVAAAKKKRASAATPSVAAPSVAGPSVAHKVVALLHHAETLAELGKAKTKALKAAAAAFHAATNAALDAYQAGLNAHVNAMKFLVVGASHLVVPAPPVMPSPADLDRALLEHLFVKPSKWRYNTPPPAPLGPSSVQSLSSKSRSSSEDEGSD
ncbi:hypothetical protein VE02_10368 [Pseudogymnoascus sp. 03VT05]|nr:hypothetical protein VE02_10368 [Pseudogymnoascus sp. 03VT05]